MKNFDSILEVYNTVFGKFNREAIITVKCLYGDCRITFSSLLTYGNVGIGQTHFLNVIKG